MSRRGLTTLLAAGAVALVLAYGVYSVLVIAYSDRLAKEFTLPATRRAVKLAPGNARYWVVYADLLEQAGEASTDALKQAAALDPENASIWLRLGLDAEGRNDFGGAEKFLLQAARVSRLYEPRWTLANFYFRRGNSIEFWKYARSALELAPREPEALFDLCWRKSQDAAEILAKAIPDVRPVRRHYAEFLLGQNRLAAAHAVLMTIGDPTADDRAVLEDACDRFLAGGLAQPALDVWDVMCSRGVLPFKVLQPQAGVVLTNPDFAVPGFGRGFDWH